MRHRIGIGQSQPLNRPPTAAAQPCQPPASPGSWLLASCFLLSASCFSLGSLTCLLLSQVPQNAIRTQPRNGGRRFQAINNHFQRASAQSQARAVLPWLEPLHISRNALNYRPSSLHRRYFDQSRTSRTNFQILSNSHCSL